MPNDDSLKDGIAKYTGQAFKAFDDKFQDQVYKHHEDGKVERLVFEKTEDLLFDGHKMQSTLQRDIAHARLQLAITQALCAYVEETNTPERVGLTQIDFEHHGARVSVKVEMGDRLKTCTCKGSRQCGYCKRRQDEAEVYNALLADQKKMEQELLSTRWRANNMYTSREDQERHG